MTRRIPLPVGFFIVSAICFSALIEEPQVKADTFSLPEGVTVSGEFTDTLTLSADTQHFFHVSLMAPGDDLSSVITLKNTGEKDIQVTLWQIENLAPDDFFLKELNLRLSIQDTLLYDGPYSDTGSPVIPWINLHGGQELLLAVNIFFPPEAGNEYQDASFETKWHFLARADETEPAPATMPETVSPTTAPSALTPTTAPVISVSPALSPTTTPAPAYDKGTPVEFPLFSGTPTPPVTPWGTQAPSAVNHNPESGYNGTQTASSVKTGDDTPILQYLVITIFAFLDMAGLTYILILKKRGGRRISLHRSSSGEKSTKRVHPGQRSTNHESIHTGTAKRSGKQETIKKKGASPHEKEYRHYHH